MRVRASYQCMVAWKWHEMAGNVRFKKNDVISLNSPSDERREFLAHLKNACQSDRESILSIDQNVSCMSQNVLLEKDVNWNSATPLCQISYCGQRSKSG